MSNFTSNDSSAIDAYTQGVEITSQKRYDAGIVKIWSGNPGHFLRQNRFGMGVSSKVRSFKDADYFNPVAFIEAQDSASPLWSKVLTYPIIIGDKDQLENLTFDGVIEPLSIRRPASFTSLESPFEFHDIRGSFGAGNVDSSGGSDQILTVEVFDPADPIAPFTDDPYFDNSSPILVPFDDNRLVRNGISSANDDVELANALSLMTGSTDNYVAYNERAATSGFFYDNATTTGTDSLAFGGQAYYNRTLMSSTPLGSGTFDPVFLPFSSYNRYYDGSPWGGDPSPYGASLRSYDTVGSDPSIGFTDNGDPVADFTGGGFELTDTGSKWKNLASVSSYTLIAVAFFNTAAAPDANPYNDPAIFSDSNAGAYIGLGFNSSGVSAYHLETGTGLYTNVQAACSTGAWHLVVVRYDGTNLSIQVDSDPPVSIVKPNIDAGFTAGTHNINIGATYTDVMNFDGMILELATSQFCLTDHQVELYKGYINENYGFTL